MVTFIYLTLFLAKTELLPNCECEKFYTNLPRFASCIFSVRWDILLFLVFAKEVRAPNPSGNDSNLGQSPIPSVCKEVRALIPSGNDSKLGLPQISSDRRDISLQIHSGIAIKLWHSQMLRNCRELTYWSPVGRETNFGRSEKSKERRVVSPCHSISSQSLNISTTSEYLTYRFWSAVRYRMPWGRVHLRRCRVRREMRFRRTKVSRWNLIKSKKLIYEKIISR